MTEVRGAAALPALEGLVPGLAAVDPRGGLPAAGLAALGGSRPAAMRSCRIGKSAPPVRVGGEVEIFSVSARVSAPPSDAPSESGLDGFRVSPITRG